MQPLRVHFCRVVLIVLVFTVYSYSATAQNARGVFFSPTTGDNSGFNNTTKIYENSYAVIIGIDAYRTLPKLGGAVKDARSVEEALKKQGFETFMLLDEQATRSGIARLLGDQLSNKVRAHDRVLVYFAGHGVSTGSGDSLMGYLMPVEGERNSPRSSGISMDELQGWFADYESKHVMFVADACYSGLALSTRSAGLPEDTRDYLKHITSKDVRVALVAGGKGEEANEYRGHGLFTLYLLEAIDGSADANQDGIITSIEIAAYVSPRVSQLASQKFRASQNPQMGRRGEGEFVFLSPRGAKEARGSIYVTSTPADSQIFVDGKNTGFRTPHSVPDLLPGIHQVNVVRNGVASKLMNVAVSASSEAPVSLAVQSAAATGDTGVLDVKAVDSASSEHLIANVIVDGINVGTTDFRGVVPAGNHLIEVRVGSGAPFKGNLYVSSGKINTISATFANGNAVFGNNGQTAPQGPTAAVADQPPASNASTPVDAPSGSTQLSRKIRKRKIPGHILLWGGLGITVGGLAIIAMSSDDTLYSSTTEQESDMYMGIGFTVVGVGAAVTGLVLLLSSRKLKRQLNAMSTARFQIAPQFSSKNGAGLQLVTHF